MAKGSLTVRVRVAWWLRWYLSGVGLMSAITGLQPDMEKVSRKVMRAITFRFEQQ